MTNSIGKSWPQTLGALLPEMPSNEDVFRRSVLCIALPYLANFGVHHYFQATYQFRALSALATQLATIALENSRTKEEVPVTQDPNYSSAPEANPYQPSRRLTELLEELDAKSWAEQQPLLITELSHLTSATNLRHSLNQITACLGELNIDPTPITTLRADCQTLLKIEQEAQTAWKEDEVEKLRQQLSAWRQKATIHFDFDTYLTRTAAEYINASESLIRSGNTAALARRNVDVQFRRIPTPMDGNCLYHAVLNGKHPEANPQDPKTEQIKTLRKNVADHLRKLFPLVQNKEHSLDDLPAGLRKSARDQALDLQFIVSSNLQDHAKNGGLSGSRQLPEVVKQILVKVTTEDWKAACDAKDWDAEWTKVLRKSAYCTYMQQKLQQWDSNPKIQLPVCANDEALIAQMDQKVTKKEGWDEAKAEWKTGWSEEDQKRTAIEKAKDGLKTSMINDLAKDPEVLEAYAKAMERMGEWGGRPETFMIAYLLQVLIIEYSHQSPSPEPFFKYGNPDDPPVYICNIGGGHYTTLIPKKTHRLRN